MQAKIMTYRGFEISLDIDDERFVIESDTYDTKQERNTLSACKKWVDEYIKQNDTFRPFVVFEKSVYKAAPHEDPVHIIGIRKDGRYIMQRADGEKKQVSSYDESNYVFPNPDNDAMVALISEKEAECDRLRSEIRELAGQCKWTTLKDYRKSLNP